MHMRSNGTFSAGTKTKLPTIYYLLRYMHPRTRTMQSTNLPIAVLLLLLFVPPTRSAPNHLKNVKICATPEIGFWEKSEHIGARYGYGSTLPLYAEIDANGGNTSLPVTGIPTGGAWHYSGFYADMLPSVMSIAGIAQYTVTFYPTYTSLLYAVTKSNDCDVGWASFTNTAQRAWCSNTSHSILKTPACTDPKPGEKPAGHHACCAHFGVPTQQVSLGLLISGNTNSANVMDLLASYQVVNIIGLMAFAVIAAAHIVWYLEREENSEQFPRNYMDGIDDAIWWSCTTVTTVGYGDKYPITALGRTFGLLWMFVGVAFLGLFAGTISGAIDGARSSIHTPYDVSPTQKVCIPLELYSNEARSLNYGFNSYINSNGGVNGCVADLLAGKCDAVFYDEPILLNILGMNSRIRHSPKGFKVVEGVKNLWLGPAYSQSNALSNTLNFAFLSYANQETYRDNLNKYFGNSLFKEPSTNAPTLDWALVAPVLIYISVYLSVNLFDTYTNNGLDTCWCCKVCPACQNRFRKTTCLRVRPSHEQPPTIPNLDGAAKEDNRNELDAVVFLDEHDASFKQREKELMLYEQREQELQKRRWARYKPGANRTLFANGPEINGMIKEIHSVHRLLMLSHQERIEKKVGEAMDAPAEAVEQDEVVPMQTNTVMDGDDDNDAREDDVQEDDAREDNGLILHSKPGSPTKISINLDDLCR